MKAIASVTEARRVLAVLSSTDEINWLSLRNVPNVHLIEAGQLNTYDVLVADDVVFTTEALEEFLGVPVVTGDVAVDAVDIDDAADTDEESDE